MNRKSREEIRSARQKMERAAEIFLETKHNYRDACGIHVANFYRDTPCRECCHAVESGESSDGDAEYDCSRWGVRVQGNWTCPE